MESRACPEGSERSRCPWTDAAVSLSSGGKDEKLQEYGLRLIRTNHYCRLVLPNTAQFISCDVSNAHKHRMVCNWFVCVELHWLLASALDIDLTSMVSRDARLPNVEGDVTDLFRDCC